MGLIPTWYIPTEPRNITIILTNDNNILSELMFCDKIRRIMLISMLNIKAIHSPNGYNRSPNSSLEVSVNASTMAIHPAKVVNDSLVINVSNSIIKPPI